LLYLINRLPSAAGAISFPVRSSLLLLALSGIALANDAVTQRLNRSQFLQARLKSDPQDFIARSPVRYASHAVDGRVSTIGDVPGSGGLTKPVRSS
jgi:hypothetical protein